MIRCVVILFPFLLGMIPYYSFAQDILWLHYFNQYKLSYKFSIDSDVGYREYFGEGNRTQFRSGLRYDINENIYVRGGLMYVDGTQVRQELRLYQDFVMNTRFNAFTISQRVRFEEQFFGDYSSTKVRLRYNPSIKYSSKYGFLTFGFEPFITLNEGIRIGSNRTYFGITRRAYKNIFVTLEYINERGYKRNERYHVNETNLIRLKVKHVIHPLKTGPLFGRKRK